MEPLESQLTKLKMKISHVDADDKSAVKPSSRRDTWPREAQLPEHTSLMAEPSSHLATFKALERKYLDQQTEFEKLRCDLQSKQTECVKLRHDYQCQQTKFVSQQAVHNDLQREHTILKTQHQELQSKVEDYKRSESIHWCFLTSIFISQVLCY